MYSISELRSDASDAVREMQHRLTRYRFVDVYGYTWDEISSATRALRSIARFSRH